MIPIASEGWRVLAPIAGVAAIVAAIAATLGYPLLGVPGIGLLAGAVWFFRDPERTPPDDPRVVVSPADGRVLDVRRVEEHEMLGEPSHRVSIFMSPLNVHVNRSPVRGTIERIRHTSGRFHAAFADKASDENERNAVVVSSDGRRYLIVQIAGAVARRIVCRRTEGDVLERGERYGMIMFGSRVDVYLPLDVTVRVEPRMRVRAGATAIAEVPR